MSYEDIAKSVQDIYGIYVSDATISAITDKLLDKINEWRGRPLESMYPVFFMDAMFYKVIENGVVVIKAMYNVMDEQFKDGVLTSST